MIRMTRFLIVFAVCPFAKAAAQNLTPNSVFDQETVETLGRLIFTQDMTAARSTQILLADGIELSEYSLLGWIVTEDEDGPRLSYIGMDGTRFSVIFDVWPFGTDNRPYTEQKRALTDHEMTLFLARKTASRAIENTCSTRYNTVILPDPNFDEWLVYYLANSSSPISVRVGGSFRVNVSADGTTVLSVTKLFDTCQTLDLSPWIEATEADLTLPVVKLEQGDFPTEIYVYLQLLLGIDLTVESLDESQAWLIRAGRIEPVESASTVSNPGF